LGAIALRPILSLREAGLKKFALILGAIICFLAGATAWRVLHTGRSLSDLSSPEEPVSGGTPQGILVEVAGTPISSEDLEWEYSLHTRGVSKSEELTPIPDLGVRFDKELAPLKQKLMAGLIERKMLFNMVQQDKSFGYTEPGRYTNCLSEWQETTTAEPALYAKHSDKERLKARMCERSIVDQYMEQKLFAKLKALDAEVEEYYKNHSAEFKFPPQVTIRHIMLSTEKEAKEVRGKVTRQNFEEIARTASIAPEGEKGGRLGPFAKGEYPSHFNIAFEMQPGQITDILKSTYGFHIIMLVSKTPKSTQSLEQASAKIRSILERKKREEEYKKWVELALHTVPITTPKPLW